MKTLYPDPAERELARRGYSAWAMLPSFIGCFLLSLFILMGGWFFDDIRGLGQEVGSWVLFEIVGVIWVVQLLRWLYRGACYSYVLGEKHFFFDHGFRYPAERAIELNQVEKIQWGMYFLGRQIQVGWVLITCKDGREVKLTGIRKPNEFAQLIVSQVTQLLSTRSE